MHFLARTIVFVGCVQIDPNEIVSTDFVFNAERSYSNMSSHDNSESEHEDEDVQEVSYYEC